MIYRTLEKYNGKWTIVANSGSNERVLGNLEFDNEDLAEEVAKELKKAFDRVV